MSLGSCCIPLGPEMKLAKQLGDWGKVAVSRFALGVGPEVRD